MQIGILASAMRRGTPLLLDTYTGAVAAYSLRKLKMGYTGSAIRVRRSSDNTEQDIGFLSDVLDETALTNFVGANNGFITKWYDQAGSNIDATNSTATAQPRIVNAGTIDKVNSKPTPFFDGSDDRLATSLFSQTTSGVFTAIAATKLNRINHGVVQSVLDSDDTGSNRLAQHIRIANTSNTIQAVAFNTSLGAFVDANGTATAINYLFNTIRRTSNVEIYVNNATNGATTTTGTAFSNSVPLGIGGKYGVGGSAQFYQGYIYEVIIFNQDKTTDISNINTAINTFYSIY